MRQVQLAELSSRRRHNSLAPISSTTFKLNDLVCIKKTKMMGHIIEIDGNKRLYFIKFADANGTKSWIAEPKIKKMCVAYFHGVGAIEDEKSNDMISSAIQRYKWPHAQILLPNDNSFSDIRFNTIKIGMLYYYQNPDIFYLKLLSDFLTLLAQIKIAAKELHMDNPLNLEYLSSVFEDDLIHETSLNFKRIAQFADGNILQLFTEQIARNYPLHPFIGSHFKHLVKFHDTFIHLNSKNVFFARDKWDSKFEKYLKTQVYDGQFEVDIWISLIQTMMSYYNTNSERQLKKLILCLRQMGVSVFDEQEIKADIIQLTKYIRSNLINMQITKSSEVLLRNVRDIQQLAKDKLIVFNSVHIRSYLHYWMIEQQVARDIHIFIDDKVVLNAWFKKYVVDSLESRGFVGFVSKLQLVHVPY